MSAVATDLIPPILLALSAIVFVAYRFPSVYSAMWPRLFIGGVVAFLLLIARNYGVETAETAVASLEGVDVAPAITDAIRRVRIDVTLPMLALLCWTVFVAALASLPEILGRNRADMDGGDHD